jgi:Resolvase, N terminal domain
VLLTSFGRDPAPTGPTQTASSRTDERTSGGIRAGGRQQQDLTAQRDGLHALRIGDDRIDLDHRLTGASRDRPDLRLALAACRGGDTFVVTKLDQLARSLPDARDILDELLPPLNRRSRITSRNMMPLPHQSAASRTDRLSSSVIVRSASPARRSVSRTAASRFPSAVSTSTAKPSSVGRILVWLPMSKSL